MCRKETAWKSERDRENQKPIATNKQNKSKKERGRRDGEVI